MALCVLQPLRFTSPDNCRLIEICWTSPLTIASQEWSTRDSGSEPVRLARLQHLHLVPVIPGQLPDIPMQSWSNLKESTGSRRLQFSDVFWVACCRILSALLCLSKALPYLATFETLATAWQGSASDRRHLIQKLKNDHKHTVRQNELICQMPLSF